MTGEFPTSRMVTDLARRSLRPTTRPGPAVISLAAGDPDFETPEHVITALTDAVASGATHYAELQGDAELRDALAEQIGMVANRDVGRDQVLVTHGGSAGLAATVLATLDPGDRVIVPEPTYSLYADLAWMAGAEVSFVANRPDRRLDLEAIAAAAAGARLLFLCNPNNPTGTCHTREELEDLAEIADRHGLLVVADEAYDNLVYDGVMFTSALEVEALAERLVYVQTFSKTYAMTGWRIGYLSGPRPVVAAATRIHRAFNGPVNTAVQRAALTAVTERGDGVERMRREYQARRDIVTGMLDGVSGLEAPPPEGGLYTLIGYGGGTSSLDVIRLALERGVAVRAGSEFGPSGEGHVRIAFATSRELLIEGIERLLGVLEDITS